MSDINALRDELLGYDTCLVSDVLEKLGLPCGITGIHRQATATRIFGRAVTMRLEQFQGIVAKKHLGTTAIDLAAPGDIIVIQHQSRADCAGWGGLLSTAAKGRGVGGVVVDGMVRDIDESETLAFPVFSRGVTPVTARNRVVEVAVNEPVDLAGVRVMPGDYIMADGSGVAVMPAARLEDVVAAARAMMDLENGIRDAIAAGKPLSAAMNESYERATRKPAS